MGALVEGQWGHQWRASGGTSGGPVGALVDTVQHAPKMQMSISYYM